MPNVVDQSAWWNPLADLSNIYLAWWDRLGGVGYLDMRVVEDLLHLMTVDKRKNE